MTTTTFRRRAAKGFTLIELLIVVIIIAILAAIAIPQFSNTSGDAQESAAIANLTTMRSAVELYRIQHNNTYPSTFGTGTAPACTGTAGKGTAGQAATFTEQMTQFTDATGHVCSIASPGYSYGPYMRAIPVEPITNAADVTIATSDTDQAADDATTKGWRFVNVNGKTQINTTRLARDGKTKLSDK
ncbi:Type II secretion system protein G [Massilia sp. Bi118]|uniref:prepilin-type N-terminal cleavage/methylation domain-containing protein n=1 Tax=Massilia sp. Bi118 TaxID=2822346 RepID=UPI001D20AF63|nr:prepilin-type N-terminal cleavage/methylation domain-containing protein [Massilia sp. Bi118]CAH0248607.1 Type II secretion system protein G [Massilia sp. Bi118]